jgi:multidrug efflux system membrane fusion protein
MKILILTTFAFLLFTGCGKKETDEAKAPTETESQITRSPDGEIVLTLNQEAQSRIGLKVETTEARELNLEVKSMGRVMDPAPLAALVNEVASAEAAYAASRQDWERLQTLSTQQNASVRSLQTAEATARHDELQLLSARAKLNSSWGKSFADQTNLSALVQSLLSLECALVLVDLPPGDPVKSDPTGAALITLSGRQSTAAFLGRSPSVDPQTQNEGLLFLIQTNSAQFLPGSAVTAFVKVPGSSVSGIVIPRDAVIRHEGATWIYLKTDDTHFTRRRVSLDRPADNGWIASSGVKTGDQVVVTGAQTLFSQELNASGFLGGERD